MLTLKNLVICKYSNALAHVQSTSKDSVQEKPQSNERKQRETFLSG